MNQQDPLFAALTRPAIIFGVAIEGLTIGVFIVSTIFIATSHPLTLLLYIPVHFIMYCMCLKNPRCFRILWLMLNTKGKSTGWRYWKVHTATPMTNRKNNTFPE